MFAFTSYNGKYDLSDDFDWKQHNLKVTKITSDNNGFQIEYNNGTNIDVVSYDGDYRDMDEMDTNKCNAKGCCFEHSTCGYEKCLEHYPAQKVEIECDTQLLVGEIIVDFILEEHNPYYSSFSFILANGSRVPLELTNNLPQYLATMHLSAD